MTVALTAAQALAYITALSADVEVAAVLDPEGRTVAGHPALGAAAAAHAGSGLRAGGEPEADGESRAGRHAHAEAAGRHVHLASDAWHTIVVICGRFALPGLSRHDLAAALRAMAPADASRAALDGQIGLESPSASIEPDVLEALIASVFGATEPRKRPISV